MANDESKCAVSGKRKYMSEGEALATAAHQIATANAPKDLRAYLCSWGINGKRIRQIIFAFMHKFIAHRSVIGGQGRPEERPAKNCAI